MNWRLRRSVVVLGVLGATLACSGGGDDGPTGNNDAIQITATPATLSLQQGTSGTVNVQLSRIGGFSGAVSVAITGLPAGVTTTVTPSQLTGATTAAAVAVDVAASVVPGPYTATVTASGTGVTTVTAQYQLTVTAAPNYALTVTPATITVAQGASGTAAVAMARTNFTGAVTLTLTGAPAGMTGTFNPASPTTDASTLTIAVAGTVAPGTYPVTVNGAATGIAARTAPLSVTVTAAPGYTMVVAPATLTIGAGGNATANVNITRENAFAGAITLAMEGAPNGITAAFNPASVSGTQSVVTISVAAAVAAGSYPVTVKGTAAGLADRVATITLTVAAPVGSIAIALTPAALTVQQGASGQTAVNVTRTNFAGDVSFTSSGAPAGVTVSFAPPTTSATSSSATVAVAAGVAVGNYPITITATGTGAAGPANATLTLGVTTPAQGTNSTWEFCSASDVPSFFAFQDGTGAWQRVTPAVSGSKTIFSFSITQNRGGVAYLTTQSGSAVVSDATAMSSHWRIRQAQALADLQRVQRARASTGRGRSTFSRASLATVYDTYVTYATAAELATLGTDNCSDTQPTKSVNGTVAGVSAGEMATLSLGGALGGVVGGQSMAVQFDGVPFGNVDLIGTRSALFAAPNKIYLQRNLNVADGGTLPNTIDFDGANAFAPATATATIANLQTDDALLWTLFSTSNGESGIFAMDLVPTPSAVRPWFGVPANKLVSGDVHGMFLFASPDLESNVGQRLLLQWVSQVSNRTLTLGPTMSAPTSASLAAGAYPRYRFQGTLPAEYRSAVSIGIDAEDGGGNGFQLMATGGYLALAGSAGSFDLSMPDLVGVSGFPVASRVLAGPNEVTLQGIGWNGSGILTLRTQDGDVLRAASHVSLVNVP